MRDMTVFDALFITKIVKEFIKHRERVRSEFLTIWTEQACLLKYILLIIIVKEKVSPLSPPQTPAQLASLANFFFSLLSLVPG